MNKFKEAVDYILNNDVFGEYVIYSKNSLSLCKGFDEIPPTPIGFPYQTLEYEKENNIMMYITPNCEHYWVLFYYPNVGTDNSYVFSSCDLEELIINFYEFIKDKSDEYFGN